MSLTEAGPLRAPTPPKFSCSAVGRLIRLPNQSGTFLLLLPTLWSLVLAAQGRPSLNLLAIFVAGSFLMRSAGVVLNDIADRSFDRQVSRTHSRPLATGEVTVLQALVVAALLILAAAALALLLNPLAMLLSPIALALAALYPLAKRVVQIPQAVLGIAFGWGTVMAWAASRGSFEAPAWCLFGATVCWAIAYDTIYAIQDREDDLRIGVKSSAILFGPHTWWAVGACLSSMLVLLAMAGILTNAGVLYFCALIGAGGLFLCQVVRLRDRVTPEAAFAMFTQHVWAGWTILLGSVLGFASAFFN